MHIEVLGSGHQHVLAVHGWGGGWHTFAPLVPSLPDHLTLHAVDLPGYGRSAPLTQWRYEEMATALAETIDQLSGDLTLFGNCSGGLFGLLGALERPERFERLILIDPFAFFPWYFSLLTTPMLGRLFYATAFQNPFGRRITDASLADHKNEETNMTRSFEALNHSVVHQHLCMLRQMPGYQMFSPLTMPITVLYGERTFKAIRESLPLWRSIWPHLEAREIAAVGHLPIEENPVGLLENAFP